LSIFVWINCAQRSLFPYRRLRMSASLEWSARTRRQETLPVRGAACVVEPDDAAREHMADALRRMGFTTHETGSGAVGSFIAGQIHLQVVLVNVALTDAMGLKLVRRFRTTSPEAAIVAVTSDFRMSLGAVLARFAGADAVLAAPVTDEALGNAVTRACGETHAVPAA
jgi:DNA-binding response OmpR family regulator